MVLTREWNSYASLVSNRDVDRLEQHVADSLSLCTYIKEGVQGGNPWLDVGTGGGFPAIPLKIVLEDAPTAWVERSERKVGFLTKAAAELGLNEVKIHHCEFPHLPVRLEPGVVTARAVERPERVMKQVLDYLPVGGFFLCQTSAVGDLGGGVFHVEHIVDAWSGSGYRRGELYRIRREI
jgi:16S rRNA (guanine527-N7)-methyltransferase